MATNETVHEAAPERTGVVQYLSIFLLWALVFVTFYQFFTRYVLNDSAAWTEEIAQYGLVVIVFVGSIIASRKNGHIKMLILRSLLPGRIRYGIVVLTSLIETLLIFYLFWLALRILPQMHLERMVFADIPLSIVYGAVAIFLVMHLVYDVRRLIAEFRNS